MFSHETASSSVDKQEISEQFVEELIGKFAQLIHDDPKLLAKAQIFKQKILSGEAQPLDEVDPSPTVTFGLHNRKKPNLNKNKMTAYVDNNGQSLPTPNDLRRKQLAQTAEDPSFIQHVGKLLLQSSLGLPGLALAGVAGMASSVAALPVGVSLQTGSAGGDDLCSSMVWCIQSALKNTTTGSILAQFSRDFGLSGNGGSVFTEMALGICFDQTTLRGVIDEVVASTPDWQGTMTASAESSIWQGVQTTGKATHLSATASSQFTNALNNAAASCYSTKTSATGFGIGLGVVLGGIVALGLLGACCVGTYACYDKYSSRKNNRFVV
ncbi:MAG: hypothetical protein P4M12_05775 [Gammaproteobacteria bacterium]|nr:hypothetical protein [Gammaproteobacteria bacterium]